MNDPTCDSTSGCATPVLTAEVPIDSTRQRELEVVYVGDPMCSWCWGASPALGRLLDHCSQVGIAFRVVVGGLRPGGGQAWDAGFKRFLREHWEEVARRTDQPFSFRLLAEASFNYDTEPACRAIVAARPLLNGREFAFFEAVQRKFYVESEDPAHAQFYESVCGRFDVEFQDFARRFDSAQARRQTLDEFRLNRNWGVTGFPTVLWRNGERLSRIASGYATFEDMKTQVERLRAAQA